MDFDETMVEESFDEAMEADTPLDDFVEEDESEEVSEEELELPDEGEQEETVEEEQEPPKTEPGWIKKRVQKAVDKAVAQALAAQQERFDQQMAPLLARMAEDEAQELVRSRKVNDIETARELVRLRQGMPKNEPPRNEQGQFTSKEQIASQAATEARIEELKKQADKIQAKGGPDVIAEFNNNADIKRKVIDGEMDFYDVAEIMSKPKKRNPSPARSPNGSSNITPNAFSSMSKEQFERMERQIDKGVRYKMR